MQSKNIESNPKFIGRKKELEKLSLIASATEAAILIVYGRRRIGKTELLEQAFRTRNVLKFEGIEGFTEEKQIEQTMLQLSRYVGDPLLAKVKLASWTESLLAIARYVAKGTWTVYFEEVQWLAGYEDQFIAALKYVWDNELRHNSKLIVILCGSSPSFMIRQVLHSKALYNRSEYELHLQPFTLPEARMFLAKRSVREVMDAYLTIGGIPEYLKWVNKDSSVFLSLCHSSFRADSFFSHEYERIFTSSLSDNPHYKRIIEFLSKHRFATRSTILKHLQLKSGGTLTALLEDLELSGFVGRYTPFNLKEDSLLARYAISDPYLQFYFRFIKPIARNIDSAAYDRNPSAALNREAYFKCLGHAFERFCRDFHHVIARILGFGAVAYKSGVFFDRASDAQDPGYQLDLVYDRADMVYTICEIKYLQSKVSPKVIPEFEKKLALFSNPKQRTIERVLIANEGADSALISRGYFDRVITLDELFNEQYW